MRPSVIALALSLIPAPLLAQTAAEADFFTKKAKPILEKHCFSCHSHAANKAKGQLVVDSRAALLKGGETGPAIDLKHPHISLLVKAIEYADDDLRMPPKGKLADDEIAILKEWVVKGAVWPGAEKAQAKTGHVPGVITAADRAWWAFQPVKATTPPKVNDADWNQHPIDRFLLGRLEKEGLKPAPRADKVALIRRATFDLIGLPPTPEEVDAFLRDADPKAYEKLVDRLLASPRYGERMARHWLDLVRFAETDGFRLDTYRTSAWRYRDYVVRAFNADKPYDQFVREQLAGDEANPGDADALVATGFLAAGIYEYNQRDVRGQWNDMLNEVTDVTADVFLGLGMGCARCHDHKFDPILQKDYYRLRAFFEPIMVLQEEPYATPAQRKAYEEKAKAWLEKTKAIRDQIEAIEGPERLAAERSMVTKFPKDIQEMMNKAEKDRAPLDHQLATLAYRQITYEFDKIDTKIKGEKKDRLLELRKELAKFDSIKPAPLPLAQLARDVGPVAPPTLMPKKGSDPIAPGYLTLLDENAASVTPTGFSTGRRLALANWIASADNPLSTRVIVNRIWQQHFGQGLAANASDFGKLGEAPSHPELLDWLADAFVKDGWSMKKMHRLIVTSRAYQQSATPMGVDAAQKKDPENRLVWRGRVRRLEAEQIRDSIFAATGRLDLTAGGPSVELRDPRRAIYAKIQRNTRDPLLDVFDLPEGFTSTPQRNVTTTATQSLLLINSTTMQQHAKALAERVRKECPQDEAAVDRVFRLVFGRSPSTDERKLSLDFLKSQPDRIAPQPKAGPGIELGKLPMREGKAVVFTPGSGPVRMMVADTPKIPRGDFTLEAYVLLRSTFEDGSVRTIASLWDGDTKSPGGWSIGVTSKKSAYKPQMLVLQLCGETKEGKRHYEPVFSSLRLDLNKPYYIGVSVKLGDTSESGITFYTRDLANDEDPVQVYQTTHKIMKLLPSAGHFAIGGNDSANERAWDGLIDDVRLSSVALRQNDLLLTSETAREDTVGFWQFEPTPGHLKDSSANALHLVRLGSTRPAASPDAGFGALVDLCLALLNSNEFLYVD